MTVLTKTIFSGFLIFFALVAFFTMFELLARGSHRFNPAVLRITHRIAGFCFTAIFLSVSYFCIRDFVTATTDASSRAVFHAVLAIAVLLVLFIKILIVRSYRQYMPRLPQYGQIIFSLAIILVLISGGYYSLLRATGNFEGLAAIIGKQTVSKEFGRHLLELKCSKCHTLERIFFQTKSPQGWATTVRIMQARLPGWINDTESEVIIDYLKESRGPQLVSELQRRSEIRKRGVDAMTRGNEIFRTRCSPCHYSDKLEDKVGPGLLGLFGRGRLPFSGRPATIENVKRQLRTPINQMPPFTDLTDEQVEDVVAFLLSL